jgi:hypothetical protein
MITNCSRTPEVLARGRKSSNADSLREHLETCAICTDALAAEHFMQTAERGLPQLNQLPDPTTIWWRSRLLAQQGKVARATMPIRILEQIAFAAGATGVVTGVVLVWPSFRSSAASWMSSLVSGLASGTQSAANASSASQVLLFGTAILAMIAVGLYSQWAEE